MTSEQSFRIASCSSPAPEFNAPPGRFVVVPLTLLPLPARVELEELRVNQEFTQIDYGRNFWNTALYLGLGYHTDNVTVGVRYNVLYDADDFVYSEAFMPFVRVYF